MGRHSLQLRRDLQASIDDNVTALLVTGFAGLLAAAVLAMFVKGSVRAPAVVGVIEQRLGLLVTFGLLLALSAAYRWWDDFSDQAHGLSAVFMFVLLGAGIGANASQRWRRTRRQRYCRLYTLIVVGMAASAVVIGLVPGPWEHRILVLEAARSRGLPDSGSCRPTDSGTNRACPKPTSPARQRRLSSRSACSSNPASRR